MDLAEEIEKLQKKGVRVDSALRARIEQLYSEGRVTRVILSGVKSPLGIRPGGGFVSLTGCPLSRTVALRLREATHRKVQALRGDTPRGTWLRHLIEEAIEHKCTA